MRDRFDLVVIGGGAAGLTAAGLGAQLGAKTLLVERDRLGGDCTWYGCVPSKALLHASRVAHLARSAGRYGLEGAAPTVDLGRVLGRVREIQKRIYEDADQPEIYARMGVEVRFGQARFTDSRALVVSDKNSGSVELGFRFAVIASGSRPAIPSIPGLEQIPYLTNETVFGLDRLPQRLAILGGGPIGVELGQAFQRLGAAVTILQRNTRILPRDEPELAAILRERLAAEGVEIRSGVRVSRAVRRGTTARLWTEGDGGEPVVEADALVVAVGRAPNHEGLNLSAAGVRTGGRGIPVDARCRTNRRHIYACGDAAGELFFTHVAEHMARVAVTNAIVGLPAKLERRAIPWVTFTDPELAHVGARREDLERSGRRYRLYRFPFSRVDRAVTHGATEGEIMVLATPWSGRILGASILGEGAGEMIAELVLALKHGIPLRKIADTIHAYPTLALGNRRAADQWYVQKQSPTLIRFLMAIRRLRGRVPPPPDPDRVL